MSEGESNGSNVFFKSDNVKIIEDDVDLGSGTLQIDSKCVKWDGSSKNMVLEYVDITMHAISRDNVEPHIYCQLRNKFNEDDLHEIYIYPKSSDDINTIFMSLSKGAELNPDPPEEGLEDLEEGHFYYNIDEVNQESNFDDNDEDNE